MDRKRASLKAGEVAGPLLLILLLLLGLLLSWYMGRQQDRIARALEDSAWLALSGQWEDARETAARAKADWEQRWHRWAALGDHSPMEEIDALFAQLTIYGAAGERTEFSQLCSALSCRIKAVGNAHRLRWWNIL